MKTSYALCSLHSHKEALIEENCCSYSLLCSHLSSQLYRKQTHECCCNDCLCMVFHLRKRTHYLMHYPKDQSLFHVVNCSHALYTVKPTFML